MGHGKSGGGSKFAEGSRALGAAPISPVAGMLSTMMVSDGYKAWQAGLTEEQRGLLDGYTDMYYQHMNYMLRNDGYTQGSNTYMNAEIDKLQETILSSKIPFDMTVYRGIENDTQYNVADLRKQIGQTMVDKGFGSTSLDFHTGYEFTGYKSPGDGPRLVYQYTLPKGLSGAYLEGISAHPGEKEVLLPHGAKFRITGVRTINYRGALGDEPPEKVIVIQAKYLGSS